MFAGGIVTPTAARAAERSRAFHARIAERAAKVLPPVSRTYFIPNKPFGEPKPAPPKPLPIDWQMHCRGMWFYDLIWPAAPKNLNNRIDLIINTVGRHFGLNRNEIRSQRRTAKEVVPRQLAMFLCKELTQKSLPEIGRRIGGKDHTTVIHGIRRTQRRLEIDSEFAARYRALKRELCS